jgi:hypothetical protein
MTSSGPLHFSSNGLDIPPDDAGVLPETLSQMLVLDMSASDFMFKRGSVIL